MGQDCGGGDAIDIVVTEDADSLSIGERTPDAVDHSIHVRYKIGIGGWLLARVQERADVVDGLVASSMENRGDQRVRVKLSPARVRGYAGRFDPLRSSVDQV